MTRRGSVRSGGSIQARRAFVNAAPDRGQLAMPRSVAGTRFSASRTESGSGQGGHFEGTQGYFEGIQGHSKAFKDCAI